MSDSPAMSSVPVDQRAPAEAGRRDVMRRLGAGALGGAVIASIAGADLALSSTPAQAAITDVDIFNFALNFEYLGAEFYLRAVSGSGLPSNLVTGTGTQGSVSGGSIVPFAGSAVGAYAQRLAVDELAHVQFLRTVLGSAAIAEPSINLSTSWTMMAIAAGLIVPGQVFNPFADPISFLLGAYILEDVCVTALTGAAGLLTSPANITAAAGLLGTEGYHGGAIRALLSDIVAGQATDAISNLRMRLSGQPDDVGTLIPGQAYNITPTDINGLAFRRTPTQVLNIAYGGGAAANFGFFPSRVNGTIQ